MPPVMPHLLYVSATDAAATYASITAALRHANAGDKKIDPTANVVIVTGNTSANCEKVLEENGAEAFLFGERGRFPPKGIADGNDAALNVFSYEQDDGWKHPPLASKMRGIKLRQGQAVRLATPGGGGYGASHERLPASVARDVARGLMTEENADKTYGTAWREVTA